MDAAIVGTNAGMNTQIGSNQGAIVDEDADVTVVEAEDDMEDVDDVETAHGAEDVDEDHTSPDTLLAKFMHLRTSDTTLSNSNKTEHHYAMNGEITAHAATEIHAGSNTPGTTGNNNKTSSKTQISQLTKWDAKWPI